MTERRPSDPAAALVWDYQLRERVPDFQDHFDRGVALSEAVYARLPHRCDVAYGDRHPREAYDLFPAAAPGGPGLIFIHGGYWQFLSRDMFAFVAGPLVEAGCAVAMLGYPLIPDVTMPALAETVAWGVVAARDGLIAAGADPARIHLAGHSAGAHLATLTATWPTPATAPPIRSVTAISGIYDLKDIPNLPQNAVIGLRPEEVAGLSPIRRLGPGLPALHLVVGAAETPAFHDQQAAMAAAWAATGAPVTATTVPDRHHFDVVLDLADGTHPTTAALLASLS